MNLELSATKISYQYMGLIEGVYHSFDGKLIKGNQWSTIENLP